MWGDLSGAAIIDTGLDSRAATFENPSGARGAGGTAAGGRKGSPNRWLEPGERVVLADITGPGVVRHIWMTILPAPPVAMRSVLLEVFYDGADEPSVSVPCLDFFGLPHGRPVDYESALVSVNEGRGFNSFIPMPFREGVRIEFVNAGDVRALLYYQVDYTLGSQPPDAGYLHVTFNRENPTVEGRDFTIVSGLEGPGRFLGCSIGIRTLSGFGWYGEGEVKVYRDGDRDHPTICGTGLEDYVGSAWGMGPHSNLHGGAPLIVAPAAAAGERLAMPDFVGFYRWHLADPIVFERDLRVTIQQIGAVAFRDDQEQEFEEYAATHRSAGNGWNRDMKPGWLAWGLIERSDDYCATAYVYCREPQAVLRVNAAHALADIGRTDYEEPSDYERFTGITNPARPAVGDD